MGANSKIEWTDATWNPITGCTPISEACDHCYAKRIANRLAGRYGYPKDNPFRVTVHFGRMDEPTRIKKPHRIFVCSMSDLFHESLHPFQIDEVFEWMLQAPQHTYMVLTKRPQRLYDWADSTGNRADLLKRSGAWVGVTAENQARADERIPVLLQIPAVMRFVSIEPMLGPVDLTEIELPTEFSLTPTVPARINSLSSHDDEHYHNAHGALDWVICGGETGPGARPVHPDWVRSLRDQCASAGVPFFFKSWGKWIQNPSNAGKSLIDGREWKEFPVAATR